MVTHAVLDPRSSERARSRPPVHPDTARCRRRGRPRPVRRARPASASRGPRDGPSGGLSHQRGSIGGGGPVVANRTVGSQPRVGSCDRIVAMNSSTKAVIVDRTASRGCPDAAHVWSATIVCSRQSSASRSRSSPAPRRMRSSRCRTSTTASAQSRQRRSDSLPSTDQRASTMLRDPSYTCSTRPPDPAGPGPGDCSRVRGVATGRDRPA
jgi:hypothetical protein